MPVDYEASRALLDQRFASVSGVVLAGERPTADSARGEDVERVFQSRTQAYREVLVGCVLARWNDRAIDITKPYVNQGPDAFNGRTLDERVVNPFFQENRIPSSRGPYLSAFRRSVKFDESTRTGLRDQDGYDALLRLIRQVQATDSDDDLFTFLDQLLVRFYELREESQVAIAQPQRISLEQISELVNHLLAVPSGGRFPMYLVEATLAAINERFALAWDVQVQGINVADTAGGAAGDIEVLENNILVFSAEVTERRIEADRVIATFQTKIAPNAIKDYMFLTTDGVEKEAKAQASAYFAIGHEVNFVDIAAWIWHTMASIGPEGRFMFFRALLDRLAREDTPTALKTAWNDEIARLTRVD